MRALACLVLLAGCVKPVDIFACETSDQCTIGGACQAATGFCSFTDNSCESGQRYGDAAGDGLANTCVPVSVSCGNGVVEQPEECDDGNTATDDDCVSCRFARCGDGGVRPGIEDCDDGNTADGDACNSICLDCSGDASVVAGGHCYMRIDAPATWDAAAADCYARGGFLASISSTDENAAVTTLAATGTAWIGLEDKFEANFFWQDDEPRVFTNYAATEPNGGTAENCTTVDAATGQWSDADCAATNPYICERAPWTIEPTTRHAYHRFSSAGGTFYPDAAAACNALPAGHLVTITDAGEAGFVDAITSATRTWIGLDDIAAEGSYVWQSGEPFSFAAWDTAAGEPSGAAAADQDCAMLRANDLWTDDTCATGFNRKGYLCEIDPP